MTLAVDTLAPLQTLSNWKDLAADGVAIVMKETRGWANPIEVRKVLEDIFHYEDLSYLPK